MTKPIKIILGLITLWPIGYICWFMGIVYASILSRNLSVSFATVGWLHLLTSVIGLGLLIIYISHLFKNSRITKENRLLWLLVLIFGWAISMPIYWYLYIWKVPSR